MLFEIKNYKTEDCGVWFITIPVIYSTCTYSVYVTQINEDGDRNQGHRREELTIQYEGKQKVFNKETYFTKKIEKKISLYDNENPHHGNPGVKPHRFVGDLLGLSKTRQKSLKTSIFKGSLKASFQGS